MITNVQRANSAGDIQRYVRYTIAPEEDNKNENYTFGERTLGIEVDNIDLDFDLERNKTSHSVADQITNWNLEHRQGQKQPTRPAAFGNISFSPEDTEKFMVKSEIEGQEDYLDVQKLLDVSRQAVVKTMGGNRPIFLAAHGDHDHLHVHFVVGLVDDQGKIFSTNERDFRTWERSNEALEKKHGFARVEHRKAYAKDNEDREAPLKRLRNSEVHLLNKGEVSPFAELQGRLEQAHDFAKGNFENFLNKADKLQISIKPNMSSKKVNGLSFSLDGKKFIKGSDIGSKYKWGKLEKGLNYDSKRDFERLAELKERASANSNRIGNNERAIVSNGSNANGVEEQKDSGSKSWENSRIGRVLLHPSNDELQGIIGTGQEANATETGGTRNELKRLSGRYIKPTHNSHIAARPINKEIVGQRNTGTNANGDNNSQVPEMDRSSSIHPNPVLMRLGLDDLDDRELAVRINSGGSTSTGPGTGGTTSASTASSTSATTKAEIENSGFKPAPPIVEPSAFVPAKAIVEQEEFKPSWGEEETNYDVALTACRLRMEKDKSKSNDYENEK